MFSQSEEEIISLDALIYFLDEKLTEIENDDGCSCGDNCNCGDDCHCHEGR